jgi:hypothetical protein
MLNTEESRKGAMACLHAMQAVMNLPYNQESEGTIQNCLNYHDDARDEFLKAAGLQSEFIQGFLSTLAQYFVSADEGCSYDVFVWKPDAARTEAELKDYRASLEEKLEGGYHA